jgi:hypothetical protein
MEKITKKQLIKAVKNIPQTAEREKWVLTFDKDEGALFYSQNSIPKETELFQITDEYSIYLDKKQNPKGVMVEYYCHNFIKHHPEFKDMTEDLFKKDKKEQMKVVNPHDNKIDDADVFRALFERTLITEVLTKPLHG